MLPFSTTPVIVGVSQHAYPFDQRASLTGFIQLIFHLAAGAVGHLVSYRLARYWHGAQRLHVAAA